MKQNKQLTLNQSCTVIKTNLTGWIGIRDDDGKRHDVCVKKCLIDRTNKKVIVTGHNGVWIVNPSQIDFTH